MFDAWTTAGHLANWFGPEGFTLPFCELDFRVGGRYRLCMRSSEGEDHWVHGKYTEIERPGKLAFTWNREDVDGNVWNSTTVRLTFAEEGGGKTRFTLNQSPFDSTADRHAHNGGWSEALGRLAAHVTSKAM